ncbi:MAG: nitroreductase [Clostridia bacterium]|nr:nitroreductase [Clostridia bacterium]
MDLHEAIAARHSVRQYLNKPLGDEEAAALEQLILEYNRESGLHIQLVRDEPRAFDGRMAHYGNFTNVTSYFALVGKKGPDTEEKIGYWGEKLVLEAQRLGLNTCWVALTYKKIPGAFTVEKGEKLYLVISLGYGATQGKARSSKSAEILGGVTDDSPEWYKKGIEAAMLAPTAINQQKFRFERKGDTVTAKALFGTPQTKIDLGIVKCHFEIGAGYKF